MSTASFHLDTNLINDANNLKFGIVVSSWNNNITDDLLEGCLKVFYSNNVPESNIQIINVPGSFELVYGCKIMQEKEVDVVIAIGCVIKGETKHFDFICNATSNGIKDLNVNGNCPVIFCVLTDNTLEQSIARSGGKFGNKGSEAAVAAIKMALI